MTSTAVRRSAPTSGAATQAPAIPAPTNRRGLEEAVLRLRDGASRFAALSLRDRIALIDAMQSGYLDVAAESVRASCLAKGMTPGTPPEGEEWTSVWMPVRQLRLLRESLAALERGGNTPLGKLGHTVDGRLTAQVFPTNAIDGMLFNGVRSDVHFQQGVTAEAVAATRAGFYKRPAHRGRVVVVLGAGNIAGIPAMDVLTKMFNEGKVCLLKMNPVNAYLGPFLERAFAEPITKGFLAVIYGGSDEGQYLVDHAGVDEIHITGSDRSFEAIVWGPPGPEREARKARNDPRLKKPINAELGNVSPVLVVPGPYSERQLFYQAEDIVSSLVFNASFNCNADKVIVTPKGWPQRDSFLRGVAQALSRAAVRKAYYPGAVERWHSYTDGHPSLLTFGSATADAVPWAFIPGVDAERPERGFTTESFSPVLYETSVGSADPEEFLDAAVRFANERLWGTLSAGLVVHPKTTKDAQLGEAVERAIAALHYGTVSLNTWSGNSFAFASPPWGAYPGSTQADIQSGCGWVHNTPMLEGIEKTVLRYPVTMMPKAATFVTHRTAHTLMGRMTQLDARGSWSKLPGVLAAALRA